MPHAVFPGPSDLPEEGMRFARKCLTDHRGDYPFLIVSGIGIQSPGQTGDKRLVIT